MDHNPMAANIGEELRAWRASKRWSQSDVAEKLGISRSYYGNLESGQVVSKPIFAKLLQLGFRTNEVGPPTIPASVLQIPIPFVGAISAGAKVNWTDPFDSETFEFVPPAMGDVRGRFSCRVDGDSMFDLLWPDDLVVFQRHDTPRINSVCLFVSHDGYATIKQLKHDGENFVLHALNPAYLDETANGRYLGYLVGIVRELGSRQTTIYDAHGIMP